MTKSLLKTTFRDIGGNVGRFLSMFLIIALGVGFFAGLTISEGAMTETVNAFYERARFHDFELYSAIGWTKDDVDALRISFSENNDKSPDSAGTSSENNDRSPDIEGGYLTDALLSAGGEEGAYRVLSLPDDIDRPTLVAGRLPEAAGECLADAACFSEDDIGKSLTVSADNEASAKELLAEDAYEITGLCISPEYTSADRGSTELGGGKLAGFVILLPEGFSSDRFQRILVNAHLTGAVYSSEYDDAAETAEKTITAAAEEVAAADLADLRDEAGAKAVAEADAAFEKSAADVAAQARAAAGAGTQGAEAAGGTGTAGAGAQEAGAAGTGLQMTENLQSMKKAAEEKAVNEAMKALPDKAKVTVLGRDMNASYVTFDSDSSIITAIGRVFPVFFFLVAALVCAATMSRNLEEGRGQIGLLMALGYSGRQILGKYVLYSFLAGATGCVAGYFFGIYILPLAVCKGYGSIYAFPGNPVYVVSLPLLLVCLAVTAVCTIGVTLVCVARFLVQAPATLLRQKAPRAGKKILLEKIPLLWKRLSFLRKVTFRNLFRYKVRSLMMIIGIAGCTALMVAGFGIRASFSGLAARQFGPDGVTRYSGEVTFQEPVARDSGSEAADGLVGRADGKITGALPLSAHAVTVKGTKRSAESRALNPLVEKAAVFSEAYVNLRTEDGTAISLPQTGDAVLSASLSAYIGAEKGTEITLTSGDSEIILKVRDVYRNCLGDGIFVTDEDYAALFGNDDVTGAWVKTADGSLSAADAAALRSEDGAPEISVVQTVDAQAETFNDSMKAINLIIVVVIIAAAMLAFIVIFNLTNINVTERRREIAPLLVLGFREKETLSYIFRENHLLAGLGGLVGLVLGKALHTFICDNIRVQQMTLPTEIAPVYLALAFALTLIFSLVMRLLMGHRVVSVDMAESLKSGE